MNMGNITTKHCNCYNCCQQASNTGNCVLVVLWLLLTLSKLNQVFSSLFKDIKNYIIRYEVFKCFKNRQPENCFWMHLNTQSQACGFLSPQATRYIHWYADENHRYIKQTQVKRNSYRLVNMCSWHNCSFWIISILQNFNKQKVFPRKTWHVLYVLLDMFNHSLGRRGKSCNVNSEFSIIM